MVFHIFLWLPVISWSTANRIITWIWSTDSYPFDLLFSDKPWNIWLNNTNKSDFTLQKSDLFYFPSGNKTKKKKKKCLRFPYTPHCLSFTETIKTYPLDIIWSLQQIWHRRCVALHSRYHREAKCIMHFFITQTKQWKTNDTNLHYSGYLADQPRGIAALQDRQDYRNSEHRRPILKQYYKNLPKFWTRMYISFSTLVSVQDMKVPKESNI